MKLEAIKAIDIHSHLNFAAFRDDVGEVISRTIEGGVGVINVGAEKKSSERAIRIAKEAKGGVWATVGLHPIHTVASFHDKDELGEEGEAFTSKGEDFNFDYYKDLARNQKVVAIGECGLDYYRTPSEESQARQENVFRKQIELALELDKPLMLHIRNAYDEALLILESYFIPHKSKLRGNAHFFAGTLKQAKKFLEMGLTLSFTGVITFTHDYDELVRYVPLDMIMAETDAPYVTPVPHRGKRNEPLYVLEVIKKIAEIKNEPHDEVRETLLQNAKRVFNIKGKPDG